VIALKPSLEGENKREGDLTIVNFNSMDYNTLTLNKNYSNSVTPPIATQPPPLKWRL
jgi:hypothetical protein